MSAPSSARPSSMPSSPTPSSAPSSPPLRVLTRSDVQRVLDMPSCIDAVENAFRLHASGASLPPGVLGTHVPGGGFHVKAAGITGPRSYYAAKINANFPGNPRTHGLPTIQGIIGLYDATNGVPLALMDSIEITSLRTAAASAVAAKYLSRDDAHILTIVGCGIQARSHLSAMRAVRPIDRIFAFDTDASRAEAFAAEAEAAGVRTTVVSDYRRAILESDLVVTCTPSREPLLHSGELPRGAFLAAVGADSETKQEVHPTLLAQSAVVVDILEQAATIGDLHHALEVGTMTKDDVRGDLAGLVSGAFRGRVSNDEILIFDSTGTALQDVAAAAVTYERARDAGVGTEFRLAQ